MFLMLATALYLACKMEECPQHIRSIASEARNLWPGTTILPNLVDFDTTLWKPG